MRYFFPNLIETKAVHVPQEATPNDVPRSSSRFTHFRHRFARTSGTRCPLRLRYAIDNWSNDPRKDGTIYAMKSGWSSLVARAQIPRETDSDDGRSVDRRIFQHNFGIRTFDFVRGGISRLYVQTISTTYLHFLRSTSCRSRLTYISYTNSINANSRCSKNKVKWAVIKNHIVR